MKYVLGVTLLAWLAWSSLVSAQETGALNLYNCSEWSRREPSNVRTSFVLGWLAGLRASDSVTSEEIISKLWPTGHRVASVKMEIDVECAKLENRLVPIYQMIQHISRRLNGLAPIVLER
jgi:hypothetical protein